jgi:hypothetical protein
MLKLVCDRCTFFQEEPEILGYANTHPYAQAGQYFADVKMPSGWEKLRGLHLCPECVGAVDAVLQPIPQSITFSSQTDDIPF